MDLNQTIALISIIVSIGVVISSLELLTLTSEYGDNGLYSWKVLRTGSQLIMRVGSKKPIEHLASGPALRWVIYGRLLGAATLILFPTTAPVDTISVACVLLCTLLINLRAPLGLDGSDQMTLIVFVTFGVEKAFRSDTGVATVCVWFIALQSCLSYCCAGFAKVISPVWRSGEAIRRVLSTRSYGTETTAKLFERWPHLCPLIAWMVIGFECAFPLVLVTGPAGFWIFIGWGILFHLLNALIMGLNTFFWAFLATYPAIWFCGRAVAAWI